MKFFLLSSLFTLSVSSFLVTGCADTQVAQNSGEGAARYLAWYDGDYQSDYKVDRAVADSRLAQLEGKPPTVAQPDEYLEYVSLLDADGRHPDALKKIRAFMETYPKDKRGVFLLAVHYWRVQKKELATYFFHELEKEQDFPWRSLLLNDLGMIALQDKNRPVAIDYFEKATKAQPATAAPFVNLGALYLQSRSWSAAEQVFIKARSLDEDFEDASLGLGVALEGQGKFEEANSTYAAYMGNHAGARSVLYNDAMLLGNRLSRKEEASQMMLRYVQSGGKETAKAQEIIQSWR